MAWAIGDDGSRWIDELDDALAADLFDVPFIMDVLPDGQEAVVIGDVAEDRALWHRQGDNPYGFHGTCGLVSCEGLLRQFGVVVSEESVVAKALETGTCSVGDSLLASGGSTPADQAALLTAFGVPAHVERIGSLEQLAQHVEHGHGVIAEVNAGWLWNDPRHFDFGQPNHAVLVTGVARSPVTGEVLGAFINDSGSTSPAAGRFLDVSTLEHSLMESGGELVVTDGVRPPPVHPVAAGGVL
jgi:hypothetical protein